MALPYQFDYAWSTAGWRMRRRARPQADLLRSDYRINEGLGVRSLIAGVSPLFLRQPASVYTSTSPRIAMFCIYCGAPNPEGASFCSSCGKNIGAPANPSAAAEAAPPIVSSAEKSSGNAIGQFATVQGATGWGATGLGVPPLTLPAQRAQSPQPAQQLQLQPSPQAQYQPAIAGKGKPVLWVLGGFGACLLIVIAMAVGSRLNQASSGSGPARENVVPDSSPTTAPAAYTAPAPAPAADTTPAPASAPVQAAPAPAPAAPQNPIVGEWKTTTAIGDTVLNFGADGRYTIKSILVSEAGVYVFSSGDGTLRLQPNALFSHDIVVWSCQLSGDSFSCVDPEGAGHVYTRIQ